MNISLYSWQNSNRLHVATSYLKPIQVVGAQCKLFYMTYLYL
jgi:hypothetical protein